MARYQPDSRRARDAVAFFYTHAGYSHDPRTETKRQGRYRGAVRLAEAEAQARNDGHSFEWRVDDPEGSREWMGAHQRDPWATWGCIMRNGDCGDDAATGAACASLWGIDFGRDGEPWGDPYRRVVEAELALETLA